MPKPTKGRPFKFPPKKIIITPADKVVMNQMFLQGCPTAEIAAHFKVTVDRVVRIVREELRPSWQESMKADAERELAKIDNLERSAWVTINAAEEAHVVVPMFAQIRWCITMRAKLHRNYDQQFREADAELRVGGAVNREAVEKEMAIRLLKIANQAIQDKKDAEAAEKAAKRKPRKSRKKQTQDGGDPGPV